MIASRRALLALIAIAVVLGVFVLVDGLRAPAVVDFALMPKLDSDAVTSLEWARKDGSQPRLTRKDDQWVVSEPGSVDARVVANTLATLRGARVHRRAQLPERLSDMKVGESFPTAGKLVSVLTVTFDNGKTHVIGIAQPLEGSEQTWLVKDGEELLVDSWVARSLDPGDALRIRTPFENPAATSRIGLYDPSHGIDVVLEGQPRRLRPNAGGTTGGLYVDAALVQKLEGALAALTLVTWLPAGDWNDDRGLEVSTPEIDPPATHHHRGLWASGPCPNRHGEDLLAVHSFAWNGCVEGARWRAIQDIAGALAKSSQTIADRRPVPLPKPVRINIDGSVLSVDGRARLTVDGHDRDADLDRVAELVEALATPGEIVTAPITKPVRVIEARDLVGMTITLDVLPGGVVLRREDGVLLRLDPKHWAILARPPSALRDPTLWLEDPSTIAAITIDGITYKRGAVLGEWTREPKGPVHAPLLDALASSLATVRAPASDATFTIAHRISISIVPPVGPPSHHDLELATPTATGCTARVDGAVVTLPLPICTAAATH